MDMKSKSCCVCGAKFSAYYDGKPYCNKHWLRLYNNGTLEVQKRKNTNVFTITGKLLKIETHKGEVIYADAEDYEILKDHSWCVSKTGYAVARINHKTVKMHRYILEQTVPDKVIDHKNHNKLDNRKSYLRVCTIEENNKNHPGVKDRSLPVGISITKYGRYRARISVNRNEIRLGNYTNLEDAIAARREGEIRYCGEFAQHLNEDNTISNKEDAN